MTKPPAPQPSRLLRVRLTIQTRVIVVDGLHGTAEIQLDVPLDQAGVKGAQVTSLVVDAGKGQRSQLGHVGPRGLQIQRVFLACFPHISPKRGDFVLRQVLVALKAIFVSVEEGQALVREHFWLLQLSEGERRTFNQRSR